VARKLCDAGFSLYASESYLARRPERVNPDDLSGHDIVAFDASLSASPAAKWLEARAGNAKVVLRSREMTDMMAAATSGLGLAVLPCMLGDVAASLKRLTPQVVATRNLTLVYRREARLSKNVRLVIAFVEATIRAHRVQITGVIGVRTQSP
jgi:DNA-binding transcriptional LysR family regulator